MLRAERAAEAVGVAAEVTWSLHKRVSKTQTSKGVWGEGRVGLGTPIIVERGEA